MGDEMGGFHVVGSSCSSIKTIIIVVYAPIFMYQAPRVSWYHIGMGSFPNVGRIPQSRSRKAFQEVNRDKLQYQSCGDTFFHDNGWK
jgi:hypothetical protein